MTTVGVLAVQGAVTEHILALEAAGKRLEIPLRVIPVLVPEDLAACHAIVLPGGESTTISRLLRSSGLHDAIQSRANRDLAVLGTCAGMILLASDADHDVAEKDIHLLNLLDATVDRNSFGRQRESFEAPVEWAGQALHGVFIRAPCYNKVGAGVQVDARIGDRIVGASKGLVLGVAFHPELSGDSLVHERLIQLANELYLSS